ncbi:aminoglycoside phosphotransferase family protein [Sulfitobacter sabulilitoris]|uniref:Aminoglycoside phosphotransferase n=1 Tax=Sulfitobacter sabulilitoris TaxID=2562655 RepID=A0A5S3PG51_9RHOB|nr:phosphotransferase [Sulfitobacter sabulilitoris]TMM53028.1 aminoglycoside phosphotransferase [Sulfitobacter sabulilitoris]
MTDRRAMARDFIGSAGWTDAKVSLLAGDASNRRYDRLIRSDGSSAVLMDAPANKGEDVRPFLAIAGHLRAQGLSAPNLLAADPAQGFLLIEDLGDDLFARVMATDPGAQVPLYSAAVDVLVALHDAPVPKVPAYDAAVMADLSGLAYGWYRNGSAGDPPNAAATEFSRMFRDHLVALDHQRQVLILRDFHAENLLWLPERQGIARVGLLDFQDAMSGNPAYDLVSVLQDARRDVSPEIEAMMIARYVSARGLDPVRFGKDYALLGLQRNLRILGVFARLCLRDGKAHYVDLLPRVWGHVETNLSHPMLASLAEPILRDLPRPTPEIRERLKSRCATIPHLS